jgi:hypothetical protein
MNVYRMRPATASILEFPHFDGASLRLGQHASLRTIGPDVAIDLPSTVAMLEFEASVDASLGSREGYRSQDGRKFILGHYACGSCTYDKSWSKVSLAKCVPSEDLTNS